MVSVYNPKVNGYKLSGHFMVISYSDEIQPYSI